MNSPVATTTKNKTKASRISSFKERPKGKATTLPKSKTKSEASTPISISKKTSTKKSPTETMAQSEKITTSPENQSENGDDGNPDSQQSSELPRQKSQRQSRKNKRRSRKNKDNLFSVIERTASGDGDANMKESKKEGPPTPFRKSIATSYRNAGDSSSKEQRSLLTIPKEELKKKGPPPSFGASVAAASGAHARNTPPHIDIHIRNQDDSKGKTSNDNGPQIGRAHV